ncbi:MAG: hypothetical protein GY811_04135 [Myxococcales bacterium]|nr:hypothetical protein [Myxococcales bacterium]
MAAQLLTVTIRNVGLVGTELARAQTGTLSNKFFKVGTIVSISVRRIHVRLSSAFPRKQLLVQALAHLRAPDRYNELSRSRRSKTSPNTCSALPRLQFLLAQQKAHESHLSDVKQTTEPQRVAWQAESPGKLTIP